MITIIYLIIQLLFAIFFFYLCLAFLTGAPFVPSTNSAATTMIALSQIKSGMTIYDLGSGNGKLLHLAAQKGAVAIGYEINPMLVVFSNIRALFSPERKQMITYWKNFWSANITKADVLFVYLLPWRMETLEKKLMKEAKPGAIIVSNSFIFPHLDCIRKDEANHIYVFKISRKATI